MDVILSCLPSTITLVLTAILTFLAVTYFYGKSTEKSRYPPGPFAFPIIGNLPQIALCGSIDVFFEKYRKIYGNVSASETMSWADFALGFETRDSYFTSIKRFLGRLNYEMKLKLSILLSKNNIMYINFNESQGSWSVERSQNVFWTIYLMAIPQTWNSTPERDIISIRLGDKTIT